LNPADASQREAHDFFKYVYEFATKQAWDWYGPGASKIGDKGLICHPGHPNPVLRATHQDHIHLQIGPT
jgi:hypothetical protein